MWSAFGTTSKNRPTDLSHLLPQVSVIKRIP